MGASIVAISSEEESQVINTIVGYDTDIMIWIGYRAAASSSTWEWASGETSDFTVWRAGEPKAEARTVPRCAYVTTDDESRSYTTREWREADCNFTTMRKGWETPLLCELGTDIAEWPTPGPTQKPTDAPTLKPSFTQMPTVTPVPTQSVESRRSHALCFETCVLTDAVGEMDATRHNGLTCDPGVGLVFDGEDDFAELAPVELGGGDFTIALWVAPDPGQNNDAWKTLVTFGNGSRTQDLQDSVSYRPPHITIESKGNTGISWSSEDELWSGVGDLVEPTEDANTADLHIVVTIRNYESGGSHSAVYRNGESVSSSDSSSDTVEKADRPRSYLGGMAEGATDVPDWSSIASGRPTKPYDAYFKGSIASLTIWNGAALNQDEVKRLYDGPRCP